MQNGNLSNRILARIDQLNGCNKVIDRPANRILRQTVNLDKHKDIAETPGTTLVKLLSGSASRIAA